MTLNSLEEAQTYFDSISERIKVLPVHLPSFQDPERTVNMAFHKQDVTVDELREWRNQSEENDTACSNRSFAEVKPQKNEPEQMTIYRQAAKSFYEKQPYFYDSNKIWWLWIDNTWSMVDETDVMNSFDKFFIFRTEDFKIKSSIFEALRKYGRQKIPEESKHSWIQFNNKIVDIQTGEELVPNAKYFITNRVPWRLGESEETPVLDRLLSEWTSNELDKQTLYEILAYSVYNHMLIHRIFCLIGTGRNGKGQFIKILKKYVGNANVASASIDLLNTRFEMALLYRKNLCIFGEIDKGIFKRTGALKGLSGDDTLRFELKGKNGGNFVNYAKPIISTNFLPESSDQSDGFYSRWTIVDFPNQFSEGADVYEQIPAVEFENFAKKSIKILKQLFERGTFANDGNISTRKQKYEEKSNFLDNFINDFCNRDINANVKFRVFFYQYNDFRKEQGLVTLSDKAVSKILKDKGFTIKTKTINGDNTVYIEGLGILELA